MVCARRPGGRGPTPGPNWYVMLIDTEAVRRQHPLVNVVAGYGIDLRRSGSALVGRCPFHADGGRPNLTVYSRFLWNQKSRRPSGGAKPHIAFPGRSDRSAP